MRHYFVKHGAPVWIQVPGTPFTVPGIPASYRRKPPAKVAEVSFDERGSLLANLYRVAQQESGGPGLLASPDIRQHESGDVPRGLLAPQVLPQPKPQETGVSGSAVLNQVPLETASEAAPHATMISNTGA